MAGEWVVLDISAPSSASFSCPSISDSVDARTVRLEDSQNLVAGDNLVLGDTMAVSKNDTNLRGSCALASKLADVLLYLVWC